MKKIMKWVNKNKTYAYAVTVAIVAFMFMLNALFTIQLKWENADLNEQIFELENRLKSAQQENQKLQTDIYIEQEASDRLGMVKSTEIPVKINEYQTEKEQKTQNVNEKKSHIFLTEWYAGLKKIFIGE